MVAVVIYQIEFPCFVFAKSANGKPGKEQLLAVPGAVDVLDGAPDAPRAEIGVEVYALEVRIVLPAVTVAASYRTIGNVVVLGDRKGRASIQEVITTSRWVIVVAVHTFEHAPAVIFSSAAGRRLKVDLFPCVLTDVGNKKVPGGSIKGTTPWVAKAVGPDLVQPGTADKRVIGRHCVVAIRIAWEIIAVNVHAQNLAQPRFQVLSVFGPDLRSNCRRLWKYKDSHQHRRRVFRRCGRH